jgi:hypothetical protein
MIFELVRVNIPGDFNANGVIDQADYTLWRQTFGSTTNLLADGNGNGVVDAADYVVRRPNAFPSAGSGAALPSANPLSAAMPEAGNLNTDDARIGRLVSPATVGEKQNFLATRQRVKF